jgi:hypothetical protein
MLMSLMAKEQTRCRPPYDRKPESGRIGEEKGLMEGNEVEVGQASEVNYSANQNSFQAIQEWHICATKKKITPNCSGVKELTETPNGSRTLFAALRGRCSGSTWPVTMFSTRL